MARTRFSGPIRSSGGFEVGTGVTNTEIIGSDGKLKLADAVGTAQLADDAITTAKIASEAHAEKEVSLVSGSTGMTTGKFCYISGFTTTNGLFTASLAANDDQTKAAQFVITSGSSVAAQTIKAAEVATVNLEVAQANGTLLYLNTGGGVTHTAPGPLKATMRQPVAVVTVRSTGTGSDDARIKAFPGYSKVVSWSS